MLQNKKVIVYVQVYNGEKYLRQCIESVLNQTYYNFVFYVIDNASKDNSSKIILEYANKDNRIIPIISKENILGRWSDLMLEWDDNSYFAIIDHDDFWNIKYLESLINFLEIANLDISIASNTKFYEETDTYLQRTKFLKKSIVINSKDIDIVYWKYRIFFTSIWGNILKVSILKKIRNRVKEIINSKININSDALVTLAYIQNCDRIGLCNEYLYAYRMHDTNSVNNPDPYFLKSMEMLMESSLEFINNKNRYLKDCNESLNSVYLWCFFNEIEVIEKSNIELQDKVKLYMNMLTDDTTKKYLKNIRLKSNNAKYLTCMSNLYSFISENGSSQDKIDFENSFNYFR